VVADWHNGKTGMIGKSYDGTLANAAAATGVDGLATIVPISAISSWYDYSRSNGIRFNTNYPSSLSNTVTNPARRAYCAPIRTILNETDGDETGDFTPFWVERDYHKDIDNVEASVFVVHGWQDNNVKTDHASKWWYGLAERDIPRKVWWNRSGHEEAFDFRRTEWVPTIHRWFDYWLQDVDNDIMDEPMADVEYGANEWVTYDDWPVPGAKQTNLYFNPVGVGEAGTLDLTQPALGVTDSYVDRNNMSETVAVRNPKTEVNPNRLVYLSEPLTQPLKLSGTAELKLKAKVNDTFTNFGVVVMEYTEDAEGNPVPRPQVTTSSEGVANVPGNPTDCWGESSTYDSACYIQTQTNTTNASQWRVTKGIVDGQNIYDYTTQTPLNPNRYYNFAYNLLPIDYVFPAGSRIGVVLVGSYTSYGSVTVSNAAEVTIDLGNSRIALPIVGGKRAAFDAGITDSGRN
jgi:X-Pro dipeptidyl-peptidase